MECSNLENATAQAGGDGPASLDWPDMPSRIIRESCRTSPNLDQLSDGAERMFWRLTTVCDDYGRFDADPRVLLALCFPLRCGTWTVEKITIWRTELVTHKLIQLYTIEQRGYGCFVTWRKWQRVRKTKPKFPEPPKSAATCGKLPRPAAVVMGYGEGGMEKGVKTAAPPPTDILQAYMARATALLNGKTAQPLAAALRKSYGVVIGLLKTSPELLEPLLDEISGLPTAMPADWYAQAIRGKVNALRPVPSVSTVRAILKAAAG